MENFRKMNILYISHEKCLGGASLSLLNVIDKMSINNNIYVLCSFKSGVFIEALKKKKVTIIYIPYFLWIGPCKNKLKLIFHWFGAVSNFWLGFYAYLKIRKLNINIIHSNTSVVNIGAIISFYSKIPHIWHIREFGKEDFEYGCFLGNRYKYNFINKHSQQIIFISKKLQESYLPYINVHKSTLIYNSLPPTYFHYKYNKISGELLLLIAGKICPAKGQMDAIHAINFLCKKCLCKVKLFIAGEGNDAPLKHYVQREGLDEHVIFLGSVKDMVKLRKIINIELVCSKSEAFGRVNLEAMMSSIPVIATKSGANPELIIEHYNGLLYEYGNWHELAQSILYFYNNPQLINEYGQNGYDRASSLFDFQTMTTKLKNVYETVAKGELK